MQAEIFIGVKMSLSMEHADLELCVDYDAPIAFGDFRDLADEHLRHFVCFPCVPAVPTDGSVAGLAQDEGDETGQRRLRLKVPCLGCGRNAPTTPPGRDMRLGQIRGESSGLLKPFGFNLPRSQSVFIYFFPPLT